MPATIAPQKKTNKISSAKIENSDAVSIGNGDSLKALGIYAEIEDLKRKLGQLSIPYLPKIVLPELHDGKSGRIDASKTARFIGVSLKPFAEGLGLDYKAVHRNPSGTGFQAALRPVKRSLEILYEFLGSPDSVRIWLNTPHPDLDGATALATITAGKADAVALILENAWNGVPV